MKLRERRAAFLSSNLYSRRVFHNALRFAWFLVVIWYELGIYYTILFSCRWPSIDIATPRPHRPLTSNDRPARVLLLSDTQVIHTPCSKYASHVWRRFLSDLNLRKNWHVASRLKPQAVIFLGDMLASGRILKTAHEYEQAARRFKSIFTLPDTPMFYVPGNTDISLGMSSKHAKDVKNFYTQSFGPLNRVFSIHNHTFVGLDAPGLVDEDYQRAAQGRDYDDWNAPPEGTVSFVNSINTGEEPIILLSHIPLSRPTTASCGPLREKGTMHRNVGHGYQSMFGKQTTVFLLEALRPSMVFSGDNRDYCEFTHSFVTEDGGMKKKKTVREVTVKSFSMSKHIRRPGFQLLSLVNPKSTNATSFASSPCLLPDQERIYSTTYPALLIATFLILFIINKTRMGQIRSQLVPLSVSNGANGHLAPLHLADDPWTPRTANSFASPRNSPLPTSRPPSFSGRTSLHTSSYHTAPHGSPPHRYLEQLDDEEAIYPTYASHPYRNHHDDWSLKYQDADDDVAPQRASVSGWKPVIVRKESWSWTFVFRGRRRRMALVIPSWEDLSMFCQGCEVQVGHARRKGIIANTIIDATTVLWPALLTWVLITWAQF
ncbi:hypothetical protein APHAL10511_004823 [Amanita phalloides]|nr:hypothetical protein APHAL10511_004823 [Amanita phalloides]